MSRAKQRDLISNTNIFQRDTWSVQTLVNLFLETGGPGVVLLVLGGNPLSPNFSETAWNIQTPFYRMDTDSLRMFYVNFHRPICLRDFFMTVFLLIWGKTTESLFHFSNSKGVQGFLITLLTASDMPWGPSNITHTGTLTAPKHWTIRYTDNAGPKGQLVVLCKKTWSQILILITLKLYFLLIKT